MDKRIYIIDGYNALHRVPEWEEIMDIELAQARNLLCAFCAEWLTSRNDADTFVVVFDGDSSVSPFQNNAYRGVRIVFTETGETADSRIISLVEDMSSPGKAVVVSDDGEVTGKCAMAGAETTSVRAFVGTLRRAKKASPGGSRDDPDGLTPAERNRITNDLKREWGID